ncbi:hypothetical protein F5884DRAFT_682501 [Xylogone sp. PMI_703]|nr:hypothetical protein F5884DRAFT_682501 [Xylogone sp. PMI_703]
MYTTIEPRLIALLNEEPSKSFSAAPSLELPPLQDPNILKASGRPLLLEPDTSKRNGKHSPRTELISKHTVLLHAIEDANGHQLNESLKIPENEAAPQSRALGNSSPQSLRKILDNDAGHTPRLSSKKRHVVDKPQDEFVQLPQPPKKQKAAKQVVPPIIIGLFEPPPQATLFPPISSSSFHDSHGRNSLNTVPPKLNKVKSDCGDDASSGVTKIDTTTKRSRRKPLRARKKWTEEETRLLLLGVKKHGVGRWTDILEDPEFPFEGRTGVDLKDRFRTCCPTELRGKSSISLAGVKAPGSTNKNNIVAKSKSSLLSENILIEEGSLNHQLEATETADSSRKQHKSRAHRKKLADLAELGIEGPFKESQRRERRPFSEEDDREILEGYKIYGPAWTRIQRDPRFHLHNRQPVDLRDRFRNKYPEKFRSAQDVQMKLQGGKTIDDDGKENTALSSTQQPGNLFQHSNREYLRTPGIGAGTDTIPFSHTFDWNEGIATPLTGSLAEMDISRLLLDESWSENMPGTNWKSKQSYTDIHSICTSSVYPRT